MKIVGYKEYLDQVCEEFPDVDKDAVARVVRHGLTMIGLFRKADHDVYINNNVTKNYYYFGKITQTEKDRKKNYLYKVRSKLRYVYNLAKTPFSGYCYFGLTKEEYDQHLSTGIVDKVYLWRIEEEAKVYEKSIYFFRIPVEEFKKWYTIKENYETKHAEFLYSRVKDGSKSADDPK